MWQGTSGKTHRLRRGMGKGCTRKIAQFRSLSEIDSTKALYWGVEAFNMAL
jgi:hypothetical protein